MEQVGPLIKLGEGEVGGKARGLPFLSSLIDLPSLSAEFAPHEIRIPETWVLATGVFDDFIEAGGLDYLLDVYDDEQVRRRFLKAKLAPDVVATLAHYLESHHGPLAVRSSSLSEDAYHHPAAGLYQTIMVPNSDPDNRLHQLQDAVKLVYASLYSVEAANYLGMYDIPRETEKIAVILEEVVGERHGDVFYPMVSGVAQSLNFFPVGNMEPEDGAASIVLGLGRRVVSGQDGMRFCPRYPTVRPQFRQVRDILGGGQTVFDAVDLRKGKLRLRGSETDCLVTLPIDSPEGVAVLNDVASTLDRDSGVFYEGTWREGTRILTFNRLLNETLFPLPRVLDRLLEAAQDGFGTAVELEFALTMEGTGAARRGVLYLLQARPMAAVKGEGRVDFPAVGEEQVILQTDQAMGHGSLDGLGYLIYVDPADFGAGMSVQAAREIAELNEQLAEEGKRYALLGPGRWGSSSHSLGIPITYPQVSGARLIAELATAEMRVEPSQGSHFFHNVVSGGLFYLTVDDAEGGTINLAWLREQPNQAGTRWAKLVRVPEGIAVRVDGKSRRGLVYRGR